MPAGGGIGVDACRGIRLVGPVAALLVLGGFLCFRGYDLPDDVLDEVAATPESHVATRS